MKKLLVFLSVLGSMLVAILPVFAGSEESLQIRVSTPLVSISLSHDTVNFGTLNLGAEKEASVFPAITNNGSVVVNLDMKGTDAVHESNTWVLSNASNGDDQYMLMISKTSDWSSEVLKLTTEYQPFLYSPSFTSGTSQTFHIKILMPTSTSAYGEYTASIFVRATQAGT